MYVNIQSCGKNKEVQWNRIVGIIDSQCQSGLPNLFHTFNQCKHWSMAEYINLNLKYERVLSSHLND